MWATENGDDDFDEINLMPEKFNSGWEQIMGPATESEISSLPGYEDYVYSDPEFSWQKVVSPVGISFAKFTETTKYDNSVFVGDCNNGHLYKFELNENRDGFQFFDSNLQDNVVNEDESMEEIIIGTGFRCITDIERGPDGFLYLVSHGENNIYRIKPASTVSPHEEKPQLPEGGGCLIATATHGSELAPQVQQLRELRDNKLLNTEMGKNFIESFNEVYYSFSPTIADWERENVYFKESVKLAITPLISSLTILNYVDINSEASVLGYGFSLILLNVGIYLGIPIAIVFTIRNREKFL